MKGFFDGARHMTPPLVVDPLGMKKLVCSTRGGQRYFCNATMSHHPYSRHLYFSGDRFPIGDEEQLKAYVRNFKHFYSMNNRITFENSLGMPSSLQSPGTQTQAQVQAQVQALAQSLSQGGGTSQAGGGGGGTVTLPTLPSPAGPESERISTASSTTPPVATKGPKEPPTPTSVGGARGKGGGKGGGGGVKRSASGASGGARKKKPTGPTTVPSAPLEAAKTEDVPETTVKAGKGAGGKGGKGGSKATKAAATKAAAAAAKEAQASVPVAAGAASGKSSKKAAATKGAEEGKEEVSSPATSTATPGPAVTLTSTAGTTHPIPTGSGGQGSESTGVSAPGNVPGIPSSSALPPSSGPMGSPVPQGIALQQPHSSPIPGSMENPQAAQARLNPQVPGGSPMVNPLAQQRLMELIAVSYLSIYQVEAFPPSLEGRGAAASLSTLDSHSPPLLFFSHFFHWIEHEPTAIGSAPGSGSGRWICGVSLPSCPDSATDHANSATSIVPSATSYATAYATTSATAATTAAATISATASPIQWWRGKTFHAKPFPHPRCFPSRRRHGYTTPCSIPPRVGWSF